MRATSLMEGNITPSPIRRLFNIPCQILRFAALLVHVAQILYSISSRLDFRFSSTVITPTILLFPLKVGLSRSASKPVPLKRHFYYRLQCGERVFFFCYLYSELVTQVLPPYSYPPRFPRWAI
jgi:hypothetical protein